MQRMTVEHSRKGNDSKFVAAAPMVSKRLILCDQSYIMTCHQFPERIILDALTNCVNIVIVEQSLTLNN